METDLGRNGQGLWGYFDSIGRPDQFKPPSDGCQTILYCCLEPSIEKESGKYYDNCKEKRPSEEALKEQDQKRLWNISKKLVGIDN